MQRIKKELAFMLVCAAAAAFFFMAGGIKAADREAENERPNTARPAKEPALSIEAEAVQDGCTGAGRASAALLPLLGLGFGLRLVCRESIR